MWASIMKNRFNATDPKAMMCRFHTQTAGSTLTAQQIENNTVRTTLQATAAILGGTQSLHTNSRDEALSLPTEKSATLALRTQQIIAHESGITDIIDPLSGSYYIEELTNEIEEKSLLLIDKIDELGGAVSAIEMNYQQNEISNSAYEYQKKIDANKQLVIGVNKYVDDENIIPETQNIDDSSAKTQLDRLLKIKFDNKMLSWPSGPRKTDGIWGKHWYKKVEISTGFRSYVKTNRNIPHKYKKIYNESMRYYNFLYQKREVL